MVGGRECVEYWIPVEELERFNEAIVGPTEVIHEFRPQPGHFAYALGRFVKNYERGDEKRIFDSIELPGDESQLHGLLMDAKKVLEENAQADCSKLGFVAYVKAPPRGNELPHESSGNQGVVAVGAAESGAVSARRGADDDLQTVIDAWPHLREKSRLAILELARAEYQN